MSIPGIIPAPFIGAAGHPGFTVSLDGTRIFKPCDFKEIDFYETTRGRLAEDDPLARFLPSYYGKTPVAPTMNDKNRGTAQNVISLGNIQYGLLNPNVLDVKIGRVAFEDNAPEKKKKILTDRAKSTTAYQYHFRIAGMLLQANSANLVALDRKEVYTISPARFPKYLERFLPGSDFIIPAFRRHLITWVIDDLTSLNQALVGRDVYFIGSSLLIIYEGEPAQLRKMWEQYGPGGSKENLDTLKETVYRFKLIDFGHSYWSPNAARLDDFRTGLRNFAMYLTGLRDVGSASLESIPTED
ncbi:hypothetical protein IWQ60_006254 [Tieghemiomyces parasiticus]|uniref:Kinase n=1 Tax=Tieghemiomyces parasiticus TaxID=78921 RepID=A0A9W8ACJ2_9FUNG|nr:hypothetical protein IWQ60_006254 [Tieghemiomyces parasiticus]